MIDLRDVAVSIDGHPTMRGELEIERSTSGPLVAGTMEIDPAWSMTDPHGHFHAATDDGRVPTLSQHVRPTGTTAEAPDLVEYYRCRICGMKIEPGRIFRPPAEARSSIPGLRGWTVRTLAMPGTYRCQDGERVTVRIHAEAVTFFGVAEIEHVGIQSRSELLSVELRGCGELGRRAGRLT